MLNLNNKGFAVSAVLYTLLVAFILFLAVVLSMLSSSSDLVRRANTDLINGDKFKAEQLIITGWKNSSGQTMNTCIDSSSTPSDGQFYLYQSPYIVKINSKYGTYYWPKDFTDASGNKDSINSDYTEITVGHTTSDGKLKSNVDSTKKNKLIIEYVSDSTKKVEVELVNICN